jgi:hypothetical protein
MKPLEKFILKPSTDSPILRVILKLWLGEHGISNVLMVMT